MSLRRWLIATLIAAGLLSVPLLVHAIPLGVPHEWTWQRTPAPNWLDLLLGMLTAVIVGAVYLAVIRFGGMRIRHASPRETASWLLALAVSGFLWIWFLQEIPPNPYGLGKSPLVLYLPSSSGYYFEARYEIKNVAGFLSEYESRMREGDVLHVGTHPPGLFLLHRVLLALCEWSPPLANLVHATIPLSARETIELIERDIRLRPEELGRSAIAALWLAVLLTQGAAVLTVVPLYLLLRVWHDRPTSWTTAAVWPLVPALAIFLPKSDALFPFIAMTFLWLWITGLVRRSLPLCAAAGLVFWLGMFLSLALLPIGLLAALLTLPYLLLSFLSRRKPTTTCIEQITNETMPSAELSLRHADDHPSRRRPFGRPHSLFDLGLCILTGMAGFLLPICLIWGVFDCNLFAIWPLNYQNHAAFYSQYSRTYWKWLLVNPLELAAAVGPFVVVPVVFSCRQLIRDRRTSGEFSRNVSVICVLGLLWLSGKNSGEAARLWLVIDPLLLILSASSLATLLNRESGAGVSHPSLSDGVRSDRQSKNLGETQRQAVGKNARPTRGKRAEGAPSNDLELGWDYFPGQVLLFLMVQMAYSLLIVSRMTGFDFPGG